MRHLDRCSSLRSAVLKTDRGGAVAESGETEQLAADQATPAAQILRSAVLHDEVGISRKVLDGDVADHIAGRGAGRSQCQPNRVARNSLASSR